jgi:hypothetical protein
MHTEDSAARKHCEARDASAALFKTALHDPIPIRVPLGGTTLEMHKALRDMRPRADIVPFRKAAPSPRPAPPPAVPLRPAAINRFGKLTQAPDRKHTPVTLDAAQRREIADLLRVTLLKAISR